MKTLNTEELNKLVNYLSKRPYSEVFQLMSMLLTPDKNTEQKKQKQKMTPTNKCNCDCEPECVPKCCTEENCDGDNCQCKEKKEKTVEFDSDMNITIQ